MRASEFHDDFCSIVRSLAHVIVAATTELKYGDVPTRGEAIDSMRRDMNDAKNKLERISKKMVESTHD